MLPSLNGIFHDAGFVVRSVRKRWLFSCATSLTLALGMSTCLVVYAIAMAVFIKPIQLPDPKTLVFVHFDTDRIRGGFLPLSEIAFLQQHCRGLRTLSAFEPWSINVTGAGEPFNADGAKVAGNYFAVLGARPELGRLFTGEDDRPGTAVTIISDNLWRTRFGGDQGVINRQIRLGSVMYKIVGVAGRDVESVTSDSIWIPIGATPADLTSDTVNVVGVGRLTSQASLLSFGAELRRLMLERIKELPDRNGWFYSGQLALDYVRGDIGGRLRVLFLAVILVFVIACANVSTLSLTRSTFRNAEFSVRAALGASHTRLFSLICLEALALSVLGALIGVGIADFVLSILRTFSFSVPGIERAQIDWSIAFPSIIMSILAALLTSLFPVLRMARMPVLEGLQTARRGSASSNIQRLSAAFVGVQFALTLILLTAATMLVSNFVHLQQTPLGFGKERVLTAKLLFPEDASVSSTVAYRNRFIAGVLAAVKTGDGTTDTAIVAPPLMSGGLVALPRKPEQSRTAARANAASIMFVSDAVFRLLQMPIVAGHGFPVVNANVSPIPAIVSEHFAHRLWADKDPVGQPLLIALDGKEKELIVVGIVGQARFEDIHERFRYQNQLYLPYVVSPPPVFSLLVKYASGATGVDVGLRRAIHQINPRQPIEDERTLQEMLRASLVPDQFYLALSGGFAALAIAIAAVGLHGLLTFSVLQRRHEIGVRIALGASKSELVHLLLMFSGKAIGLGLLAGSLGAVAMMRLGRAFITSTPTRPPVVLFAAIAVEVAVILVGSIAPLRTMLQVDPVDSIREE